MADQEIAVVPLLSVRHGTSALEFYKIAFGAREVFRVDNEKGEVVARLAVAKRNSGSPTSLLHTETSAPNRSAVGRFDCY